MSAVLMWRLSARPAQQIGGRVRPSAVSSSEMASPRRQSTTTLTMRTMRQKEQARPSPCFGAA